MRSKLRGEEDEVARLEQLLGEHHSPPDHHTIIIYCNKIVLLFSWFQIIILSSYIVLDSVLQTKVLANKCLSKYFQPLEAVKTNWNHHVIYYHCLLVFRQPAASYEVGPGSTLPNAHSNHLLWGEDSTISWCIGTLLIMATPITFCEVKIQPLSWYMGSLLKVIIPTPITFCEVEIQPLPWYMYIWKHFWWRSWPMS